MDWGTVYGIVNIYKTSHLVTYGGGPEGGYVYCWRERDPGWYRWHRNWFQPSTCTKILSGQVAAKFGEDWVEYIGINPDNWEMLHLLGCKEEVAILSDEIMQEN